MKLICVFGFAYADSWFSHEAVDMLPLFYVSEYLGLKGIGLQTFCLASHMTKKEKYLFKVVDLLFTLENRSV